LESGGQLNDLGFASGVAGDDLSLGTRPGGLIRLIADFKAKGIRRQSLRQGQGGVQDEGLALRQAHA
jgi:hypothetical protein